MTEPNHSEPENPDYPEAWDEEWDNWYWKQAEQAQQNINSSTDSFDKSMLTLSSGALGVSLAFIKDIVPLGHAVWISLLLASWIAFALCIVTTVASFLFSIAAQKKHRALLDRIRTTKNRELANEKPSLWNTAVIACARIAFVLFLGGLICTIMFVVGNVSVSNDRSSSLPSAFGGSTSVRNFYMSNSPDVETAVRPRGLEKGREPMKLVPPPKPPAAPSKKD